MVMTLAEIVSYDSAETTRTYLGQINALTASSFCGPGGGLWGYDDAPARQITNGSLLPILQGRGNPASTSVAKRIKFMLPVKIIFSYKFSCCFLLTPLGQEGLARGTNKKLFKEIL